MTDLTHTNLTYDHLCVIVAHFVKVNGGRVAVTEQEIRRVDGTLVYSHNPQTGTAVLELQEDTDDAKRI